MAGTSSTGGLPNCSLTCGPSRRGRVIAAIRFSGQARGFKRGLRHPGCRGAVYVAKRTNETRTADGGDRRLGGRYPGPTHVGPPTESRLGSARGGQDGCVAGGLTAAHTTFPGLRRKEDWRYLPLDLATFYHCTDGAQLFGSGGAAAYRLVPSDEVAPLDWGELPEIGNSRGPGGGVWYRFAWLGDGTWLAINLDCNRRDPRPKKSTEWSCDPPFSAVCHCNAGTLGQPGRNPVVALSFTELLERMLDSGGRPYWLNPQFVSYGDADEYTRRDERG